MRTFAAISLFTSLASAVYTIQDDYTPNNFASMFDFFTGNDPTDGYVNYVDQGTAQNTGLYKVENNQVYMGVDSTNVATGRGRNSIRISSKKSYNHGLIVLDLAHMPGGTCGTWPAFWLLGPDWPNKGEVDIIEGVNSQRSNSFALHTNSGCSITNTGNFAGSLKYSNCDSFAPNQPSNTGCGITSNDDQSYGTGFNNIGGGVYATQWTSEAISIWFFPRSAIPADLTSGNPNPDNWGLPSAEFTGACDIDKHVVNQQIIFDVTFCGQWAGGVWGEDSSCRAKAPTCQEFVKNNPGAFVDTFWSINGLKVYQDNGSPAPSTTNTRTSRPTLTATSTTTTTADSTTSIQTTLATTTTSAVTTSFDLPTTTPNAPSNPTPPPPPPTPTTPATTPPAATTPPSPPPPPPSATSTTPPPPPPAEPEPTANPTPIAAPEPTSSSDGRGGGGSGGWGGWHHYKPDSEHKWGSWGGWGGRGGRPPRVVR